jgi:hypothetical protein
MTCEGLVEKYRPLNQQTRMDANAFRLIDDVFSQLGKYVILKMLDL